MTKALLSNVAYNHGFLEMQHGYEFLRIPIDQLSEALKNATELERSIFKISPSGYGIHWPLIDEDIAIGKLIEDFKGHV